jgi:integrase
MSNPTIGELALKTAESLLGHGLSPITVWGEYSDSILPIVKFHEKRGKTEFDSDVLIEYLRMVKERHSSGEICDGYYRVLTNGATRLKQVRDTGKVEWIFRAVTPKIEISAAYETVLSEYLEQGCQRPYHLEDAGWVGRKFFNWLTREGPDALQKLSAEDIQRFMRFCATQLKPRSLRKAQLNMRKLCKHLTDSGQITSSFEELLSCPVAVERKLLPAVPPEELAAVLETIDRRNTQGKRDYAMILLGAVTGLRSIDIARLRLTDIDWRDGEIKIVQAKTGKSLVLPLTKSVGEALRDYILRGRPQSEHERVFLTCNAPYRPFADSTSVSGAYEACRKKAALAKEPYDGRGFHSLRRALGKGMITGGVPVTTAAQVLGHTDIVSTKPYLPLDSLHLKECALDFTGIVPEGGAA